MRDAPAGRPPARFLALALAQGVSHLGSSLTAFALGFWMLRHSPSVTSYALIPFFVGAPAIVLGPAMGWLVDRLRKRTVFLLAQIGPASSTLVMFSLLATDRLRAWHVIVYAALSSIFLALNGPALAAITTVLVPGGLVRANGAVMAVMGLVTVAGPGLAGVLVSSVGYSGVLLLDLVTFAVSLGVLLRLHLPEPASREPSRSVFAEAVGGWTYLTERRALFMVLAFAALGEVPVALCSTLVPPLLRTSGSAASIGAVLSAIALGRLAGGALLAAFGIPGRPAAGVVVATALQFAFLIGIGVSPSPWQLSLCGFALSVASAGGSACRITVWQTSVPEALQGRVVALGNTVIGVCSLVAIGVSGPIVDMLLAPAIERGSGAMGLGLASGATGAIGALFVLAGAFGVLLSAIGFHPSLWKAETSAATHGVVSSGEVP